MYCVSSFDSSGLALHMCVLPPVARTSAVRINVRTVACVDIQRCVGLLCIPVDYKCQCWMHLHHVQVQNR